MDDAECPRCKTTKYQNPSLVVMINVCGHSLCRECVELLFIKGSGTCVECGVALRRSDFRIKLFENNAVEKEIEIRKRLIKEYYRSEDDFDTLNEYNDYLEDFENIVYNLTNNVNVEKTNEKVEHYRKEKDQVLKSKMKYCKVLADLDELIEEEKQTNRFKKQEIDNEELAQKKRKLIEKEALIDELSYSEKDAKNILDFFSEAKADYQIKEKEEKEARRKIQKTNRFSSGENFVSSTSIYRQIPKFELAPLYVYQPPEIVTDGPSFPTWEEIPTRGYLQFLREQTPLESSGGFNINSVCMRLLQEAMAGLYYIPKSKLEVDSNGTTESN